MNPANGQTTDRARSATDDYKPLEEYGIIGNLETVALVGRDGAIDWCCLPHVDSPSTFARILDSQRGGHLTIAPVQSFEGTQSYLDRTNVLQTQFRTAGGSATITDFMPIPGQTAPDGHRAICRRVTGENGEISLAVAFEPRFEYAQTVPTFESTDHGVVARSDGEMVALSSQVDFTSADATANATVTLSAGETCWFVLGYERVIPDRPECHQHHLDATIDYWRNWAHTCPERSSCKIGGPWHDLAVRSGLTLKLLIHAETGGVCAAPTTSLPEIIGGVRNWDYRYNWMRDSAFTVRALAELGHFEEAQRYFTHCFTHLARRQPATVQPVSGLRGQTALEERTLDHLSGYCNSRPVRVGNDAVSQRQLDIYGELVVGIYEALCHDGTLSSEDWELVRAIVDYVCRVWQERDAGIWEIRDDPEQFVYSKVMCWAAIDRGIKLVAETPFEGSVEQWKETRETIHETVLRRGYNEEFGSFVRSFGADEQLDAATLRIPIVGFLPANDPRFQATIDTVMDRLMTPSGLVYRMEGQDGLPGQEGAFVVCSFWLINALVLAGRLEEATTLFNRVCKFTTPLGLLAEEIDPNTGHQLGNFPQAYSQVGLVNSALYLNRRVDPDSVPGEDSFEQSAERVATVYPGHTVSGGE